MQCLDDVAFGGSCEDIIHDIEVMGDAKVLGLCPECFEI